jgi:hypothetical protein
MASFRGNATELAKRLFGKSEVQNRIALNAVKMIIGDITTLYQEFKKADGLGALFFNPSCPEYSQYMTLEDIKTDIALAEEVLNDDLASFLKKLYTIVEKEGSDETPVVVMVDQKGLSIHLIDLNEVEELLNKQSDALSSD